MSCTTPSTVTMASQAARADESCLARPRPNHVIHGESRLVVGFCLDSDHPELARPFVPAPPAPITLPSIPARLGLLPLREQGTFAQLVILCPPAFTSCASAAVGGTHGESRSRRSRDGTPDGE